MSINIYSGFSKLKNNNQAQNNNFGFGKNMTLLSLPNAEFHTNPDNDKTYLTLANNMAIINKAGLQINKGKNLSFGASPSQIHVDGIGFDRKTDDEYETYGNGTLNSDKFPDYVKNIKFHELDKHFLLTGSKHFDNITVTSGSNYNFELKDKVSVDTIDAVRGITLNGNTHADSVYTYEDVGLGNSAQVNSVYAGSLEMVGSSKVDTVKLETSEYPGGNGSLKLDGNAKITGKVKIPDASKIEIRSANAYINPFLIKSGKPFNPNQMKTTDGKKYMPETLHYNLIYLYYLNILLKLLLTPLLLL